MQIRKFKKKDAENCSKLILRVLKIEGEKRYIPKRIKETLKKQTKPEELIKKSKSRTYFICEKNNKIMGIGGLKKNEVIRMYTSTRSQSKGIGSSILKKIEKQARKNKIKKLFLYTHPKASKFYLKNGFRIIKRFKDGSRVIHMEKSLK